MFFVDGTDFDPDHYNLQHEGTELLDGFEYHRFAVTPKKENSVGRFTGQIWVDPKDFHIARLKGVFTAARLSLNPRHLSLSALRELGINFHFDSWRDRTAPGIWMPAHTHFEEKSTHASSRFRTGYHFRGHSWAWGYAQEDREGSPWRANDILAWLERSQLLASPGPVEERLDDIARQVQQHNHFKVPKCVVAFCGLRRWRPSLSVRRSLSAADC